MSYFANRQTGVNPTGTDKIIRNNVMQKVALEIIVLNVSYAQPHQFIVPLEN